MASAPQSQPTKETNSTMPTLRDMIMLELPDQAKVSPGGGYVAFKVRTTNWRENRYEQHCMLCNRASGDIQPLTRSGSVQQIEWVDEQTLALLRSGSDEDEKTQIWLYEGHVGEGWAVTDHESGVEWFEPFADGFLFKAPHPDRGERKERADRFGEFIHFEQEQSASALYYIGLVEMKRYRGQLKALTEDESKDLVMPVIELSRLLERPLSIQTVAGSRQGDTIYFTCRPYDDLVYFRETTTYCIKLDAEAALATHLQGKQAGRTDVQDDSAQSDDLSHLGKLKRLHLPAGAAMAAVSPDGERLLISHQERDQKMYTREDLWIIEASAAHEATDAKEFAAQMSNISAGLDRQVTNAMWTKTGIYGVYVDGVVIRLVKLDEDGQARPLELDGIYPAYNFHINEQGSISFVGTNAESYYDVYLATTEGGKRWVPARLTDYGSALRDWALGTVETVRWTSLDGTEIEGVLRKPANFDPERRYPLVLVVHGGPQSVSPAFQLYRDDLAYYPTVQFANQDVLVLKPNYRGSLGRGQAFAELNVNNLGVGDLWDIESGVEHLVDLGWVDPERVGCMGWSQGGYISAFAGLHSDKFSAVSVGAGISDWYTYHISNDIPGFTNDYLSASPFRSREIYDKTAPISNLANAKTPILIQHGSDDKRVPLSNAMELYRGLKEMDVPVELFVYPGFGHPITKPRENHAVMRQNLAWFSHYLLGEDLQLE